MSETEEEWILAVLTVTRRRLGGAAGTLRRASDAPTRLPAVCVDAIK